MKKTTNTVFGLALGDAIGSRAQRKNFATTLKQYQDEDIESLTNTLRISDQTESGLYLVKSFTGIYDLSVPVSFQRTMLTEYIARSYIDWKNTSPLAIKADRSTLNALNKLEILLNGNIGSTDFFYGADTVSTSSHPIIRSLWLGILHAKGLLTDGELEEMCTLQTAITHLNPTVIHASFISAFVLSNLYTEYIMPGEIHHFITKLCLSRDEDYGWSDIFHALEKIFELKDEQIFLFNELEDPSEVLGNENSPAVTLAHAVMIADALYPDPKTVLRRGLFTGAASGSIASLAGAWVGAMNKSYLWQGWENLLDITDQYNLYATGAYLDSI